MLNLLAVNSGVRIGYIVLYALIAAILIAIIVIAIVKAARSSADRRRAEKQQRARDEAVRAAATEAAIAEARASARRAAQTAPRRQRREKPIDIYDLERLNAWTNAQKVPTSPVEDDILKQTKDIVDATIASVNSMANKVVAPSEKN